MRFLRINDRIVINLDQITDMYLDVEGEYGDGPNTLYIHFAVSEAARFDVTAPAARQLRFVGDGDRVFDLIVSAARLDRPYTVRSQATTETDRRG